ncbi:MAG: hypothetical protein HQ541_22135 [Mariniphaga sp.]|nr:hypothetical protein [Mariniphaga sp.]
MLIKRNIISILLLAIYSVVLAHNFVPHEHHSNSTNCEEHCNSHTEIVAAEYCTSVHDHGSENHNHIHCHFEVKMLLSKMVTFSGFYIESENLNIILEEPEGRQINYFEYSQKIPEPQCRDVYLRGPPTFS